MSYETIHKWVQKFGRFYVNRIKVRSESPSRVWNLDEIYTKTNGKMVYIWRAVDDEAMVLDVVVQSRKNAKAAKQLLYKLMRSQGVMP
ncbi:MAG: DDE-type integrase/transposase/recombinase [Maricaulaceae bacterium]